MLLALHSYLVVKFRKHAGFKPNLSGLVNSILKRPIDHDFYALKFFNAPQDMAFVDIGANYGHSLQAIRLFQKNVSIIAFEPIPSLCDNLVQEFKNDKFINVQNFGLGSETGEFQINIPYYDGVPFEGLASFYKEEAENWFNSQRIFMFDKAKQVIKTVDCKIAILDSYNLSPSFIKIDVQGFERHVIRGGLETIKRTKPVILMENNKPEEDAADLFALGYMPFAYKEGKLMSNAYGTENTFYIHPDTRGYFTI